MKLHIKINGAEHPVDTYEQVEQAQDLLTTHNVLSDVPVYDEDGEETGHTMRHSECLEPKALALAGALGDHWLQCANTQSDEWESEDSPGSYLVLTEDEREQYADAQLESYIDECILPECPEAAKQYFDRDGWKRDALLSDGYGHLIASYDHEEREVKVDGTWYYIYRVN